MSSPLHFWQIGERSWETWMTETTSTQVDYHTVTKPSWPKLLLVFRPWNKLLMFVHVLDNLLCRRYSVLTNSWTPNTYHNSFTFTFLNFLKLRCQCDKSNNIYTDGLIADEEWWKTVRDKHQQNLSIVWEGKNTHNSFIFFICSFSLP
jgi:hypothetical protein